MMIASMGVALSITSIQASADKDDETDKHMPKEMCFHVNPDPNLPDPEGTYMVLGFKTEKKIKLEDEPIELARVQGVSLGRFPILPEGYPVTPVEWGDWVGIPISGTCHKHEDKYQCSLQSISAITTPYPKFLPSPPYPDPTLSPIGWSVITTAGFTTLVHDLTTSGTTLSLAGQVDVSYFDPDGVPIPDDSPILTGLGLKTFKKIKDFVSGSTINEVDCDEVPHPGIPPFFIP